jgi:hypothetical protein
MSANDGKTSRREFLTSGIALAPLAALVPASAVVQSAEAAGCAAQRA